jgi:hypothetical protein
MVWQQSWKSSGIRRWETVLRAERATLFKLARLLASVPGLRGVLRLPRSLAKENDRSLEAREARVTEMDRSLIGRLARRWWRADADLGLVANPARPKDFPRIGPLLDREVDAALEVLRSVPFEELQWRGWHLQPNHFTTPLNDLRFLRRHPELWIQDEMPPEIEWDVDGQLRLLERLQPYIAELSDVPDEPAGPGRFHWRNGDFPRGDASAYYGIVRHLKPGRAIEIGAGWSTLMLARAVEANGWECDVTVIEPYPKAQVLGELPRAWRMHDHPVQLEDLSTFEALEPGDVVFYDGSHCVHTASDVNWMFFKVLPRLAPGVWIHVHDIMWPRDYPPRWVLDDGISWNEQYMVQAFLMGNESYRTRLAVNMLFFMRRSRVAALFPEGFHGGSLWIEKLSGPDSKPL